MTKHVVLVVEDDSVMLGVLTLALRNQGYHVVPAATGRAALAEVNLRPPDAMILDLGLPDIDGFEVASAVRVRYELPIIVLSARDGEEDQIRALDTGANDYVTKPFREAELMARVRAALRYAPHIVKPSESFFNGRLRVDFMTHEVSLDGEKVILTSKQYKLLSVLVRQPGRVITYRTLLREVWGPSRITEVHYLRVFMKQLRDKLERDPTRPEMLLTAQRVGYRFKPSD